MKEIKTEVFNPPGITINPITKPDYSYGQSQKGFERTAIRSRGPVMFYIGEYTTATLPTYNVKAGYVARDTTASVIKIYGNDNARH